MGGAGGMGGMGGAGGMAVGAGGMGSGAAGGAGGASASSASSSSGPGTGGAASSSSTSSSASGTTSATGTGGAGGGSPNLDDSCPGTLTSVAVGDTVTFLGTTLGAADDFKTFCADADATTSAPDVVYQVDFASECTMTLALQQGPGFEAALGFRSICTTDADCTAGTPLAGPTLTKAVPAGTYSIVVDGVLGTSGSFVLDVTCDAPQCGDSVVNAGEECDGGPGATPSDGCGDPGAADACKIQQTVAADTCASVVPVSVGANSHLLLPAIPPPFNSIGSNDDYQSVDPICTPFPAVDQVFGFLATASGTLTISVGADELGQAYCLQDPIPAGCWNHTLYLREGDCEAGTELMCSYPDYVTDNGVTTVTATVTAGTTYYLFVDGSDMTQYDSGPYLLDVTLQ
jgi:hypothetical protein